MSAVSGMDADNPCPKCGETDIGPPIPEDQRHLFGFAKNFRRHIGMYDRARDRTMEWMCCECGHKWPR